MKYLVAPTSGLHIVHRNKSSMTEITIQLGLVGPTITINNSTYISGVYDSTTNKKNPGFPYCELQDKKSTITDDWLSISTDSKNQLTLNLKMYSTGTAPALTVIIK